MPANPYIPTTLLITEVSDNRVSLSWTIDPAVLTRPGTYYKIYISTDGVKYVMTDSTSYPYYEFTTTGDPFFVKISSIMPSLGESPACAPIRILHIPQVTGEMTVAVDPQGRPANVKVDADGRLLTALDATAMTLTFPELDTTRRVVCSSLRAEDIADDSTIFSMTFPKRAYIKQIIVTKESGSAASFTTAVYNKLPIAEQNKILSYTGSTTRLDATPQDIPFVNLSSADMVYIKVTPDTGVNNVFNVYISGEPARI